MGVRIEFSAALSSSGSWLKVSEGGRITLDVPDSELSQVLRLVLLRGQVLRVTVETE